MIWVLLLAALLHPVMNSLRYPNCLAEIPSNSTSNFNKNFIEITSFIFDIEDNTLKDAAYNILINKNSTVMVQQI